MDPHKRINAVVVLDQRRQVLAQQTFANSGEGHRELLKLARRFPRQVVAVEGCNGVGKHLAQRLVAQGETVFDVSTRKSTLVRAFAADSGRKTDEVDAYSVALVGLHTPNLPMVRVDERAATLRLLAHRREELVGLRTQAICRLHRELAILLPGGAARRLTPARAKALLSMVRPREEVGRLRKQLALDQLADLHAVLKRIATIEAQIRAVVATTPTRLPELYGVGPIVTAWVIGEVIDVARFPSRHHFASYNGSAPVLRGSGGPARPAVNIKGNRKLNHALHLIAISQLRRDTEGRAYYRRKLAEGKTTKEALRCLRRRISDAIFRQLIADAARRRVRPAERDSPSTTWRRRLSDGSRRLRRACARAGLACPRSLAFGPAEAPGSRAAAGRRTATA